MTIRVPEGVPAGTIVKVRNAGGAAIGKVQVTASRNVLVLVDYTLPDRRELLDLSASDEDTYLLVDDQ